MIIAILIGVILPVVIDSVTDLLNNIQHYYEMTMDRYNALPEDSILKSDFVNDAIQSIQHIDIKQYLEMDKIIGYVMTAVQAVTGVVDVFVALIVSIYILAERTKIIAFLKRVAAAMFKERTYKNVNKYFNSSNEVFFKFIASQFLDAVVVGTLITIALTIMGVKYAPLLGFFIGLFNMIPFVGAIIATVISALITLITGGLSQAIWMLIITIVLQQIDANIINPKIVGQSLKISPLLVLFAVTVGGAYLGIWFLSQSFGKNISASEDSENSYYYNSFGDIIPFEDKDNLFEAGVLAETGVSWTLENSLRLDFSIRYEGNMTSLVKDYQENTAHRYNDTVVFSVSCLVPVGGER